MESKGFLFEVIMGFDIFQKVKPELVESQVHNGDTARHFLNIDHFILQFLELLLSVLKVALFLWVDKVIVTSDASSPTGLPPGRYMTLNVEAVLEANGKLHIPERKCLAGSASTMAMCMNFLDSLDFLTEDELRMLGRDNALKLLGKL